VLEKELAELDSADNNLNALKKQQAEALDAYRKLRRKLSTGRQTSARVLSKTSPRACRPLAWRRPVCHRDQPGKRRAICERLRRGGVSSDGHPGTAIASARQGGLGGELARLSLACQVACSAKDARCMVFDEVDSGVGGAVAEIVGRELKALGFSGQGRFA
jgi:DNA repair protein RecN (Recombination protein N)